MGQVAEGANPFVRGFKNSLLHYNLSLPLNTWAKSYIHVVRQKALSLSFYFFSVESLEEVFPLLSPNYSEYLLTYKIYFFSFFLKR